MALPNFMIAGVPKAGTTSLSYYLQQHPDVYLSPEKEPRYFLVDPDNSHSQDPTEPTVAIRTMAQYTALFDGVTTEKAIGEATPFYMNSPVAIRRISQTLPNVKLIFSLRDPVARAYSAYWYNVRSGKIDSPVEEVLTESSNYVMGGRYYHYLSKWYEIFDPEQIKVLLFDDLQADSLQVCREVFRFLGVDDEFVPDLTIRNMGGVPKNRALDGLYRSVKSSRVAKILQSRVPVRFRNMLVNLQVNNLEKPSTIPDEVSRRLLAYFHEDITQLEALIRRDLSAWKH